MTNAVRFALGAIFAVGFATAAVAADTCPFAGGCFGRAAPAVQSRPVAPQQSFSNARMLPGHGGWSALVEGERAMITVSFDRGAARFALLHENDKNGLVLWDKDWQLTTGQAVLIRIAVDDNIFQGTAVAVDEKTIGLDNLDRRFVDAVYQGQTAFISAGGRNWDIPRLNEAAATRADVRGYQASLRRRAM